MNMWIFCHLDSEVDGGQQDTVEAYGHDDDVTSANLGLECNILTHQFHKKDLIHSSFE